MTFIPITEASLRSAMRDRRYWQSGNPEREAYVGWVTNGWHALEGSPHRNADGAATVFVQAYSRVRDGHTEQVAAHWRSAPPSAGGATTVQDRGSVPPGYGQRVPGPQDPVGRSRSPIEIDPGTNPPGTIQGRLYSGHALDRLQGRGLPPSAVENTVRPEHFVGASRGAHVYWDPSNRVMVVINPKTNTVITAVPTGNTAKPRRRHAMTSDRASKGRSMPNDILMTIDQFQAGKLRLSTFLDRTWAQIHDLSPQAHMDVAALEDLWTEIEIIYAQASAARQPTLDDEQAHDVERVMNELASALRGQG